MLDLNSFPPGKATGQRKKWPSLLGKLKRMMFNWNWKEPYLFLLKAEALKLLDIPHLSRTSFSILLRKSS